MSAVQKIALAFVIVGAFAWGVAVGMPGDQLVLAGGGGAVCGYAASFLWWFKR